MKLTPSSSLALSAAAAPADPAGSGGMSASESHNLVTDHEIVTGGHQRRQTGPTRTAPIPVGNPPVNPGTGQIVVDVPIQAPGTGRQRREPQDLNSLPIASNSQGFIPDPVPTNPTVAGPFIGPDGLPIPGLASQVVGTASQTAGNAPARDAKLLPIQYRRVGPTNGSR